MKLNKYIFAALITSTTLFLGSCSDFLDRSPQGQFTEDDNPNALVNGKIYNVYTMMRNYNVTAGPPAFAIHCFRSEDSEKGSIASDGSDVAEMYDDFVYTPTNGLLGAYWGQNYAIIYQCNEILDAIAEKETAGQTETEDIINKGEASFFRAYCYFNLVRAFGEVPLVTYKINDASEANIPKTTADKIYEQIDKDLKTAEESLPETWSSEYTGRLTWGAARSLHARTYMMRNDWNNMYTASTDVIKKGLYNLKTPYNEIFTDDGENNGGSIFELQCTATAALPQSTVIGSQFCEVQGVRGALLHPCVPEQSEIRHDAQIQILQIEAAGMLFHLCHQFFTSGSKVTVTERIPGKQAVILFPECLYLLLCLLHCAVILFQQIVKFHILLHLRIDILVDRIVRIIHHEFLSSFFLIRSPSLLFKMFRSSRCSKSNARHSSSSDSFASSRVSFVMRSSSASSVSASRFMMRLGTSLYISVSCLFFHYTPFSPAFQVSGQNESHPETDGFRLSY